MFQEIAQARAAEISETFQRQFDAEVLEREHPGEPSLAYFELAPQDDVDADKLVQNVVSLANAGWKADTGWIEEQTGYELEESGDPKAETGKGEEKSGDGKAETGEEATIANRLQALSLASDEEFAAEFAAFNRDFPQVGRILNAGGGNPWHSHTDGRFTSADMGGGSGGGAAYDPAAEQSRGEKAMRMALDAKADVLNAMEHRLLGSIDFRYGDKKRGIAYLLSRRNAQQKKFGGESGEQIAMRMPKVIARGTVRMEGTSAVIEHEGYRAILTKGWDGQKNTNRWLLNGYDLDEKKRIR